MANQKVSKLSSTTRRQNTASKCPSSPAPDSQPAMPTTRAPSVLVIDDSSDDENSVPGPNNSVTESDNSVAELFPEPGNSGFPWDMRERSMSTLPPNQLDLDEHNDIEQGMFLQRGVKE